jgi:hypothetical protein
MNAPFRFALLIVAIAVAFAATYAQEDSKKALDKKDAPASEAPKAVALDPKEANKVYRSVTPEKLDAVLKALNIDAAKIKGKNEGMFSYEFVRGGVKTHLHCYGGRDLWIDTTLREKLSLDDINAWNRRAKFSRAVQLKGEKDTISLEAQLDCVGGVTDNIIRQFIQRFDGEVAQFNKFITK